MSSILDKMNLRPQERRLVVIVSIVVFVVLNIWIVRPIFGDLGRWQQRTRDAEGKLKLYEDEVKKKPAYEKELKNLEVMGGLVASEEQALQLQKEVQSAAALSGVLVQNYNPSVRSQRTNAFFEEQTLVITVNTGEKELIDFLYNLGARNSLIRVRSMSLAPDPAHMRLTGSITLVESFQRKSPAKSAAPAIAGKSPVSKTTNPPIRGADPALKAQPPSIKSTNLPVRINPPNRS